MKITLFVTLAFLSFLGGVLFDTTVLTDRTRPETQPAFPGDQAISPVRTSCPPNLFSPFLLSIQGASGSDTGTTDDPESGGLTLQQAQTLFSEALGMTSFTRRRDALVLNAWQENDQEAALAWLLDQPDDRAKQEMVYSALSHLSDSNPQQAFELIDRIDTRRDHNSVRGSLIYKIFFDWAQDDPQVAAMAQVQIGDEELRNRRARELAVYGLEAGLPEAQDWAQEYQLPADPTRSPLQIDLLPGGCTCTCPSTELADGEDR